MAMVFYLIALCIAFAPVAVPASGQGAPAFNPSGYFLPIATEHNASRVRWILLAHHLGQEMTGPLYVELRIGKGSRWTTYSQARLAIDGRDLSFVTKPLSGRRFEFEGTIYPTELELSNGAFTDPRRVQSAALRGVLRSYHRGRLIRSEKLAFFYTNGD